MGATLRKIGVLLNKDLSDVVKNPTMLLCCLIPIAFMLVCNLILAGKLKETPQAATVVSSFFAISALCMTAGMVASVTVIYGIAEEREKHTLRTLMLANVSAGQIVASRGIVALIAVALVDSICYFMIGEPRADFISYLLIGLLGALPVVLISLLIGLSSPNQMTAGLTSTPVFIVALAPMFGIYGESFHRILLYLPTGGMAELSALSSKGMLFTQDALLPLGITLVWIIGFRALV